MPEFRTNADQAVQTCQTCTHHPADSVCNVWKELKRQQVNFKPDTNSKVTASKITNYRAGEPASKRTYPHCHFFAQILSDSYNNKNPKHSNPKYCEKFTIVVTRMPKLIKKPNKVYSLQEETRNKIQEPEYANARSTSKIGKRYNKPNQARQNSPQPTTKQISQSH